MMRPMVTSAKIKNIFIGAPKLKQMLCRNPAKSFVPYCKHVTAILLILFEPKLPESVKGFDIPESRVSRKCLAYSPLPAIWLDCKGFRRFQVSLRRAECCEPLEPVAISCYYTIMNRTTFIEKLIEVQRTVEQLLAQLQASETDKFVAHLYQARKQYRLSASDRTRATRPLSARLSQATRSRRAWDSTATSALGNTCCRFTNEESKVQEPSQSCFDCRFCDW